MHGLVNRALQRFLVDTYGQNVWDDVRLEARLTIENFESMLLYPDHMTMDTIKAASRVLQRDRASVLEDLGTFLLSSQGLEALRRLLRLGGDSFYEFLISLDDLSGRAKLAMPDLDMPELTFVQIGESSFAVDVNWTFPGAGYVFLGALRALADDYGALAIIEADEASGGKERITIELFDADFASGRSFSLAEQLQ